MENFCLYHANCTDGIASAWAIWRNWRGGIKYIPVQYGEGVPEKVMKSDIGTIYILDFSYSAEELKEIEKRSHFIYVIDHHKTAEEELSGWKPESGEKVFDMNQSGCVLTWNTLYPNEDVPMLLRYIQDRDLWKWKLDRSREISAGLSCRELNFESIDALIRLGRDGLEELMLDGGVILKYQKKLVEGLCEKAVIVDGCAIINSCLFQSEIGHRLCEKEGVTYAKIYFDNLEMGKRIYSLRSIGDFDVSEIAKERGGGGHKNAAGYEEALRIPF